MFIKNRFEDDSDLIKILRDHVARLTSQNLELQQRIKELEKEKLEAGIGDLTFSIVRSLQRAQLAIEAETTGQQNYAISRMQMHIRGFMMPSGEGGMGIRLPNPEQLVQSESMGNLRIDVSQIPQSLFEEALRSLTKALQDAQVAFDRWIAKSESAEAQDVLSYITHLLSVQDQWKDKEFRSAFRGLAKTLMKFFNTIADQVGQEALANLRLTAEEIQKTADSLPEGGEASRSEIISLSKLMRQMIQSLMKLG